MNNRHEWKNFAGTIEDDPVVINAKGLFDYMKVSIDKVGQTGTSIGIKTGMRGSSEFKTPRDSADAVLAIDLSTDNEAETPTNLASKVELTPTGLSGAMVYRVSCRVVQP